MANYSEMGSNDDDSLVSQLHRLGARTTDSLQLTKEEACAEYEMTPGFFDQAWPAYFSEVANARPGAPSYCRFVPLKPNPDPVGLLFPRADPPSARPSAVVLRQPWEIHPLDDPAFAPYLDELEAAITPFSDELTAWGRSSRRPLYGPALPDTLTAVGQRQMMAARRLVKPILQKTHRKLSSFSTTLLPHQYDLLHAHLFLADLLEAGARLAATAARGRAAFDEDLDAQDATLRRLEVIGECKKVLELSSLWHALAGAPWGDATGIRDILAHGLVEIDLDVIWQTATEDIPRLMLALQQASGPLSANPGPARGSPDRSATPYSE